MIKGQEKICAQIDQLNVDSFPRSLMLIGPRGSGKHMLCKYISDRFNLSIVDITESLNQEQIEELYNRVEPYLYIIKVNEISVKEENTILKFLEEPLKNSFIVLIAETDLGILDTILNRCQKWYLQNYKKEHLKEFLTTDNPLVLEVAQTPGQVIEFSNIPLSEMLELANKIIDKISIASISNTLSLSSKLAFKGEAEKFDIKLFTDLLSYKLLMMWRQSADKRYSDAYLLTNTFKNLLSVKNLDNKAQFERYLIDLRRIMKGTTL